MTKAFIDTSVILRPLIQDDPMKARAGKKLLRQAKQQDLDCRALDQALPRYPVGHSIIPTLDPPFHFAKLLRNQRPG